MPGTLKTALVSFAVFLAGASVIAYACFENGWSSITHFIWGIVLAGIGLLAALLFAAICAITRSAWRRSSLASVAISLLLLLALFLFWWKA